MTAENRVEQTSRVFSVDEIVELVSKAKERGQKIGLITGCFDILHFDHIELFKQAKKEVDLLVVGVENDETLRISKGSNRPVNNLAWRCGTLSELRSVDLVFPIGFVVQYGQLEENDKLFEGLYRQIKPDFLITNTVADSYWQEKRDRALKMGIAFIGLEMPNLNSSSLIAERIQKEI